MECRSVIFRIDSNKVIGLGHVIRCLSIADGRLCRCKSRKEYQRYKVFKHKEAAERYRWKHCSKENVAWNGSAYETFGAFLREQIEDAEKDVIPIVEEIEAERQYCRKMFKRRIK